MNFDADRIASLASLRLNQEEKEVFQKSMSDILTFVETITKLDLVDSEAQVRSYDISNVMRDDIIQEGLSIEELSINAPKIDDSYIIVPQVIKK